MVKTTKTGPIFYVYEHWRPDKDVCFYVGKGHGKRAQNMRRGKNRHHGNIVAKLARLGMCVEVRMVRSGLTEAEALTIEIDHIAFWRSCGTPLSNLTSGGEGVSGLKHSEETRRVIRAKRKAQKITHSEETRRKIGIATKGKLAGRKNPEHGDKLRGHRHTDDHRNKISKALMGRAVSAETRSKIGSSNRGKIRSEATIEALRASHLGKRPSLETRAKMTASHERRWAKIKREESL